LLGLLSSKLNNIFAQFNSAFRPKFLRYQESNLLIPKLFLRKTAFIYMTTAQEAGKPVPEAEISPLIDKTWAPLDPILFGSGFDIEFQVPSRGYPNSVQSNPQK